jgi:ankyrin repeat protein
MGGSMSRDQVLASCWFAAVIRGDAAELQELANLGTDFNARDSRGLTALMIAASKNHYQCLVFLLRSGAALDTVDALGWTATVYAAHNGNHSCLQLLAQEGANLDAKDFLGTTAAMRAAIAGHESILLLLDDHGADMYGEDGLGVTAAAHSRKRGHARCTHFLEDNSIVILDKGATSQEDLRTWMRSSAAAGFRRLWKASRAAAKKEVEGEMGEDYGRWARRSTHW